MSISYERRIGTAALIRRQVALIKFFVPNLALTIRVNMVFIVIK